MTVRAVFGEGGYPMIERRSEERMRPPSPVPARIRSREIGRLVDLSPEGAQVQLSTAVRPEDTCFVFIELPNGEIVARALVRYCRAQTLCVDGAHSRKLIYFAGLSFENLPPKAVARLHQYLLDPRSACQHRRGRSPSKSESRTADSWGALFPRPGRPS